MRWLTVSVSAGIVMVLGITGCGGSLSTAVAPNRPTTITFPPASKVSQTQPNGAGLTGYGPPTTALHPSRAVRSDPVTSLPPGRLILATLRLRSGAPYFIYGQRIRFQGRQYFCLSAGNPNGSFQTCPPWPLAHEPTHLLIGGGPPAVQLALAIAPHDETCTFLNLPGGPYHASRVQLPTALQVNGEVIYALLKPTPGGPTTGSTGSGTGVQLVFDSGGKARCAH